MCGILLAPPRPSDLCQIKSPENDQRNLVKLRKKEQIEKLDYLISIYDTRARTWQTLPYKVHFTRAGYATCVVDDIPNPGRCLANVAYRHYYYTVFEIRKIVNATQ